MPRSLKRASDRLSATSSRSLEHVDVDGSLVVHAGREHLAAGRRNGRIPQDDLRRDTAHRLDAERQRGDVQQQQIAVAGDENVRLHGRAERHDLVGIELAVRGLAKQLPPSGERAACGSIRRPAQLHRLRGLEVRVRQRLQARASVRSTIGRISASKSARVNRLPRSSVSS
jgi:hypothetical protein